MYQYPGQLVCRVLVVLAALGLASSCAFDQRLAVHSPVDEPVNFDRTKALLLSSNTRLWDIDGLRVANRAHGQWSIDPGRHVLGINLDEVTFSYGRVTSRRPSFVCFEAVPGQVYWTETSLSRARWTVQILDAHTSQNRTQPCDVAHEPILAAALGAHASKSVTNPTWPLLSRVLALAEVTALHPASWDFRRLFAAVVVAFQEEQSSLEVGWEAANREAGDDREQLWLQGPGGKAKVSLPELPGVEDFMAAMNQLAVALGARHAASPDVAVEQANLKLDWVASRAFASALGGGIVDDSFLEDDAPQAPPGETHPVYLPASQTRGKKIAYWDWKAFPSARHAGRVYADLLRLEKEHAAGLILDLRDTAPADVDASLTLLDQFLPSGPLLYLDRQGKRSAEPVAAHPNGNEPSFALVLIVDHENQGMAELVASVLQSRNRALVVGERTAGKTTLQRILPLVTYRSSTGSRNVDRDFLGLLSLPSSTWRDPRGESIDGKGVVPDVLLNPASTEEEERYAVEVARDILVAANEPERKKILEAEKVEIARIAEEKEKRAAAQWAKSGVDWSARDDGATAGDLTLVWAPPAGPVVAGTSLPVTVTVHNNASKPAYRVHAQLDLVPAGALSLIHSPDKLQLAIGQIGPGQTKTVTANLALAPTWPTMAATFRSSVTTQSSHRELPPSHVFALQGGPLPAFAWTLTVQSPPVHDNRPTSDSKRTVFLAVRNIGPRRSAPATLTLREETGGPDGVSVRSPTTHALPSLAPGETTRTTLGYDAPPWSRADDAGFVLSILDPRDGVSASSHLRLPLTENDRSVRSWSQPVLMVNAPAESNDGTATLTGSVAYAGKLDMWVLISNPTHDRVAPRMRVSPPPGPPSTAWKFSVRVPLAEGQNVIDVIAAGQDGGKTIRSAWVLSSKTAAHAELKR